MNDSKTVSVVAPVEKEIAAKYDLPETAAQQIVTAYGEIPGMLSAAEQVLAEFKVPEEITPEVCETAKRIRLQFRTARTTAKKIHDDIKRETLRRGNAIDGLYNILALQATEREDQMAAVEKHFEKIEEERKNKLEEERTKALQDLGVEGIEHFDVRNMPDGLWDSLLAGEKLKKSNRIAEEKRLEEERIAKEKAEAEERARIEKENIELRKKQEEEQKAHAAELEKQAKEKAKIEAAAKKEREEAEKKLAEERAAREAEAKKIEEANAKKLAEEKKAREEMQKKLDDQAAAEKKAKEQEEARAAEEARAQKNKKYTDFLQEHGLAPVDTKNGKAIVVTEGDTFRLFKFVAEITIATK